MTHLRRLRSIASLALVALAVPALLSACASTAVPRAPSDLTVLTSGDSPTPQSRLEVVKVDDTLDPLGAVRADAIPAGSGISLGSERVSLGADQTAERRFARIELRDGEARAATAARLRAWLDGVPLPRGARFGLEEVEDSVGGVSRVVALRSIVLAGEPVLRSPDVAGAEAVTGEGDAYVAVTLSADAASRLEQLTRDWMHRRMAIVVGGDVVSAPVVRSVISGGRVSITFGHGDAASRTAEATRLAHELAAR
jgi:hypothetical protein